MKLEDVDMSAWTKLAAATTDRQSGFRVLTLCSVDAANRPQARAVVLRRVDRIGRALEFHTDTRSAKWQELSANPFSTVLGFCVQDQLQLRLHGLVELHQSDSALANSAWNQLSPWTRATYRGGPPGDDLNDTVRDEKSLAAVDENAGKSVFGVLIFRADGLDWFQLQRGENRRAAIAYDEAGLVSDCRWVNP